MPKLDPRLFEDDETDTREIGPTAKDIARQQLDDMAPLPPVGLQSTPGDALLSGAASGATFGSKQVYTDPFGLDPDVRIGRTKAIEAHKPLADAALDKVDQDRATQPGMFTVGEIAGGIIAPTIPIPGKGILPAVGRVAVNAGESALYAANTGGDPLTAAAVGTVAGTATQGLRAIGLGKAQKVVNAANDQALNKLAGTKAKDIALAASREAEDAVTAAKNAKAINAASAPALEDVAAKKVAAAKAAAREAKAAEKAGKPVGENVGKAKLLAKGAGKGLVAGGVVSAVIEGKEILENPKKALVPIGLGALTGIAGAKGQKFKKSVTDWTARTAVKSAPLAGAVGKSAIRATASDVNRKPDSIRLDPRLFNDD